MKTSFTTVDIKIVVAELKQIVTSLRVAQVYDVDHKTYLIKLQQSDSKVILLLESGSRIHVTEYDWPKGPAPSGFSMKLRKHLRNKRIENIEQLGVDRIIDITFGSGEAANHLIVELYDRGNIVLTDHEYTILNILRPRKDGEDTRFVVHEKYPVASARKAREVPTLEQLQEVVTNGKHNTPLKKLLNPILDCGAGVVEHALITVGFIAGAKLGRDLKANDDLTQLLSATSFAQKYVMDVQIQPQGFIIKKVQTRSDCDGNQETVSLYEEFHPILYAQHVQCPHEVFPSFNKACDEFFSKLESVKIEQRAVQQEKEALKRLDNVKKDHEKRLEDLHQRQASDVRKGQLIELNQQLVEGSLLVVRSAIANQIDWREIKELLAEAQARQDPVAQAIKDLKLEFNTIILWLSDPYDCEEDDLLLDSDEEREQGNDSNKMRPVAVDVDLDLSALANARKYYDRKRQAARKEQKTIDASEKAYKSAVKKTQQALKEVAAITNINKTRKVHWFEKFLWFISSENYLVIAGRDSQQNEVVVKRHMGKKDVYVHADVHGAASVVIKNPSQSEVPPKTLHEAGIMALCYSKAWDEKVVTSGWWVWGDQVSKRAPAGEYITTGAFMVRGKRNYLPPSHLVYGFGFLFRLEESCIARHAGERRVRTQVDDAETAVSEVLGELSLCGGSGSDDENVLDNKSSDGKVADEEDMKHCSGDEISQEEVERASNEDQEGTVQLEVQNLDLGRSGSDSLEEDPEEDLSLEERNENAEFPDTVVEMTHIHGDQFTVRTKPVSTSSQTSERCCSKEESQEPQVIFLGDCEPVVLQQKCPSHKNAKKGNQKEKQNKAAANQEDTEDVDLQNAKDKEGAYLKRGHRGKIKKMKKYSHQDEEEREMRMHLLQSAGSIKNQKSKSSKHNVKDGGKAVQSLKGKKLQQKSKVTTNQREALTGQKKEVDSEPTQDENELVEEGEPAQDTDDLSILSALTAVPNNEDELLYAVPVCCPYSTMANYKYKVKLTPGPGKKGKACKMALALFLTDRSITSREKNLLKAVKDSDLARNIPGKVKVSAPNITKLKKK